VRFKEIFLCGARVPVSDLDVPTDLLDDGRLVQRPDVPARSKHNKHSGLLVSIHEFKVTSLRFGIRMYAHAEQGLLHVYLCCTAFHCIFCMSTLQTRMETASKCAHGTRQGPKKCAMHVFLEFASTYMHHGASDPCDVCKFLIQKKLSCMSKYATGHASAVCEIHTHVAVFVLYTRNEYGEGVHM
jgi:hypothetical protein